MVPFKGWPLFSRAYRICMPRNRLGFSRALCLGKICQSGAAKPLTSNQNGFAIRAVMVNCDTEQTLTARFVCVRLAVLIKRSYCRMR